METELNSVKPGSNIDSWCGKCKLVLAHTIEAVVDGKPARVHCNTCGSQHTYKPNPPGATSRAGTKREKTSVAGGERTRSSRYDSLMKAKSSDAAKTYSPNSKYEQKDVLEHPTFGRGVVTAVKDATKIEVLFEGGLKTLIHAR